MRKKIEIKIIQIESAMGSMENVHLYWLTEKWMMLHAQRQVLGQILKECPERIKVKKQL